jgi:hypothetical protein
LFSGIFKPTTNISLHLRRAYTPRHWEDSIMQRIRSYLSFESQALFAAALALLFCGAVILGFM